MVPSREGGRGEGKPSPLIYEGSINFDLGSTDLGPFWGAILGAKIGHFGDRFWNGFWHFLHIVPRSPQERPRGSQEAPKTPQERPKRAQERPKSGPREAKSGLRGRQERPRAAKSDPRGPQDARKESEKVTRAVQAKQAAEKRAKR